MGTSCLGRVYQFWGSAGQWRIQWGAKFRVFSLRAGKWKELLRSLASGPNGELFLSHQAQLHKSLLKSVHTNGIPGLATEKSMGYCAKRANTSHI